MRKPIVGISYKTYVNSISKATDLAQQVIGLTGSEKTIDQVVFPSLGILHPVSSIFQSSEIAVGAQNISPALEGPYTGEVSITSVMEAGAKYVEIAHAERKRIFNESLEMINAKTKLTLESGLIPFLCIGEEVKQDERQAKKHILDEQITTALANIDKSLIGKTVLAYEPVWAIGQAEAADAAYVHETHGLIREIVSERYGSTIAEEIRIIYGGSVSKDNTPDIVADQNVDGVFIGRFGHDPKNYQQIVEIVKNK